ncbi:MAG: penicillin-binding protein 1C [Bacteroidetes bacterium 4572_117]|nr:MAG: penicillin-binding protein 1C [Bacteroidetes bacterium 4572_117]
MISTFFLLNLIFPVELKTDYSNIVLASDSTVIHAYLSKDEKWRMKTELLEITPLLRKAIIFKEDKFFYYHPGVNVFAIIRALFNNTIKNRRTSGASTITMQVARLLQPKNRTYFNKIVEMFRALQLELNHPKDEILQMYLNLAPYGGNIEGVKAASLLYFEKAPNHLSLAELTALSIIPNKPNSLTIGNDNEKIVQMRDKWLKRFEKADLFPHQDIKDALNEPLTAKRHDAPKKVQHFSRRMKNIYPEKANIYTQLDIKKQLKIEALVKNYINRLYSRNIKNAAVLVIDNNKNSVISYVGSADFHNTEDAGQVDGVKAIRSPGSTLKPLLYALAFDEGIISPKFRITDVPVNYSGYEPHNYDSEYHGFVSVIYALTNSLNVVAVKILNQYKINKFINHLKDLNFKQITKDEKKLGLSVILGGCGVTLEELTGLYHAFANNGVFTEFNLLQDDTLNSGFSIISQAAGYMLTDILTHVTRPDLPLEWQNSADLPKVAWKTGTSYGRKDAWSIGYNRNYTIGVWVGNFSAEGVQGLSGAETAAPLLFEIFNTIDYKSDAEWYDMPDNYDIRLVCSETGLVPNSFCTNLVNDAYIKNVSSNKRCQHLRKVYISADSSISYCTSCIPESGYIKALYPNYPAEMISYYESNQLKYLKIPPHNPNCERIFAENKPEITSPVNNVEYFIDRADTTEILLSCNAANDVDKVYWYINDKFYKLAEPIQKVFFKPGEGNLKVSCTDDKGRNANVHIKVKMINF